MHLLLMEQFKLRYKLSLSTSPVISTSFRLPNILNSAQMLDKCQTTHQAPVPSQPLSSFNNTMISITKTPISSPPVGNNYLVMLHDNVDLPSFKEKLPAHIQAKIIGQWSIADFRGIVGMFFSWPCFLFGLSLVQVLLTRLLADSFPNTPM